MVIHLEVGRVTKPHGLRGEVVVRFTTDKIPERTQPGTTLHTSGGRDLVVLSARPHQDRWIVHFEGVHSRAEGDALRGQVLYAEPLDDPDEIFVHQVIGRRLRTPDGLDHGEIVAVVANPASDLMELDDGRLVPMAFYVGHDDGSVTVDVPAGLLDDSGS